MDCNEGEECFSRTRSDIQLLLEGLAPSHLCNIEPFPSKADEFFVLTVMDSHIPYHFPMRMTTAEF